MRKGTLALLAALAAVSVVLLGAYFWVALLLCALLYAATKLTGGAREGLPGGARGRETAPIPVVSAWLGVGALCVAMVVIMAGHGGLPEHGSMAWGPAYTLEVREKGVFDNGADGLRVFARTGDGSEAEWRELALEIGRRNGQPDFLWVDVLEESTDEPRAVVPVFSTKEAAEALGSDSFRHDGGRNGDGVYVFGPEELEDRDYSPGMDVFETAE